MNELLDKSADLIERQLAVHYVRVAKNIVSDAEDLYLEVLESGHVMSYAEMMRYDRYFKLLASINQQLKRLGVRQVEILDRGMLTLYGQVGESITGNAQFATVNKAIAEQAVQRVWCSDGKTFSDRIWKNMNLLQATLETAIMDCAIAGKSHQHLRKELTHRFNVSQSDANRLARTELSYIQNQAAIQAYMDAGYTHYKFITAVDNRMCDECGSLNGKIFSFAEARVGVNLPPIHPNCRSNIIGYKE